MLSSQFFSEEIIYTKAERKIIDFIYQNYSSFLFMSIGQVSLQLGLSEATISRFAKHAGYYDFKNLKAEIAKHLDQESPAGKLAVTLLQDNVKEAESLLRIQQTFLEKTIDNLDHSELNKAIETMISAPHIYIYGKGASSGIAYLLQFRLNRFRNYVSILPSGGSELFESLIHVKEKDLVIIFGFQKISMEAQVILKHSKQIKSTTLLFSSRLYDTNDRRGDINLFVYRGESKEYHSMTVPTALIDTIIIMLADRLGNTAVDRLSSLHQLKQQYSDDIPR